MTEKIKALGLISGGLDSTLALEVVRRQGIEVTGLYFYTGFCITEQRRRLGMVRKDGTPPRNEALYQGGNLGIPVELVDISEPYLDMVVNPRYGYGAKVNPCLDCRIHMLRHAKKMMEERGAHFIFTGEVLGQRPMSQRRDTLNLVERESGLKGYLLRPLSAKCLPPTIPEQEGWIDREQLHGFRGRGRKPQMALAHQLDIHEWPQPAGGCCFLADEAYARKFQDLFEYRDERRMSREDVLMLAVGRHFRLNERCKFVMGREHGENAFLERMATGRWMIKADGHPGPLTLVEGQPTEDDLTLIASLTASYGKAKDWDAVPMLIQHGEEQRRITVTPDRYDDEIEGWRI